MINVQLEEHGPITLMDESALDCRMGLHEDVNEYTEWVEFYVPGETRRPVHRSVHVTVKRGLAIFAEQGALGG